MTETKCFRDAFRDQLPELSGQPNKPSKFALEQENLTPIYSIYPT